MDFLFVDGHVELVLEFVGDDARSNRAEHLAFFTRFRGNDQQHFGQALGQFAHGIELMSFAFRPTLPQRLQAPLVGCRQGNGESLGKKVVARVTGGHLHMVGLGAQTDHVVGENDFSFCHM